MANELYDELLRRLFRMRDQNQSYADTKDTLWKNVCESPDKHLEMFFHNWFNHNWTREEPSTVNRHAPPPPKRQVTPRHRPTPEEIREERKRTSNMLGLAILNSFLPDGETRLKDATGAQIRRTGGLFAKIIKFVKPTEVVGRKLTAEQVGNLWGQTAPPEKKRAA